MRRPVLAWAAVLAAACAGSVTSRAQPHRTRGADTTTPLGASPAVLLARGETIYWRGAYDSATVLWNAGFARAQAAKDSATVARLLTWLGLAAWRSGDYQRARRQGEAALALKHRLASPDLFASYNALGLLAWNEGRLLDALALDDSAAETARTAGDSLGLAKATGNRGLVRVELGALEEAREDFETMRAGAAARGDVRLEGNAYTNLAMLDVRMGDPVRAVQELADARERYRAVGFPTGEENAVGQLGTAYAAMGRFDIAFAALDSALALARTHNLREAEASDLEVIAQLQATTGNPQRALALYRDAAGLNRALDLRVEQGIDLRSVGEIYAELGQRSAARRMIDSALTIHRSARAAFEQLQDCLASANLGDPARAQVDLRTAWALAAHVGGPAARADVALSGARLALATGHPRQALRQLARLSQSGLITGHEQYAWQREDLRAQAYEALGDDAHAAAAGRAAVRAIERTRQGIGSDLLATGYVTRRSAVYGRLIATLLRLGSTDEAFAVADAMRSRALLAHLSEAIGTTAARAENGLGTVGRLRGRKDALEVQLAALERDTTSQHQREPSYVRLALEATRAAYEQAASARLAGGLGAGSANDPGATVGGVRGALAPDELIVEYVVREQDLLCFAVSPHGLHYFVRRVPSADLMARVRLVRDLMGTADDTPGKAGPVLRALYQDLLGPLRDAGALDGVRRLVLVPEGGMFYLPFAALQDPRTGHYLVQDFVLEQAPSAATAIAGRRASRGGWTHWAIEPGPPAAFAPFPDALPGSRQEAQALGRLLRHGQVIVGSAATERRVRLALATALVVHLATHGVMNPVNPAFSRLELARVAAARGRVDPADDGQLEMREVLGLRINHSLVFLSGCETGLGPAWSTRFAPGEDYATLAGAFLFAGARAVVGTLWSVRDDAAATLATGFYQRLGTLDPAEALASVQRELIRGGRVGPRSWAGYAVLGT